MNGNANNNNSNNMINNNNNNGDGDGRSHGGSNDASSSGKSVVSGLKIKIKVGGKSSTIGGGGGGDGGSTVDGGINTGGSANGSSSSSSGSSSNDSAGMNSTSTSYHRTEGDGSKAITTTTTTGERPEDGLPLVLGNVLTITDLGRIEYEKPGFHSDRYIFPVGFKSERLYFSYKSLNQRVKYICEILDLGGDAPMYRVSPEDDLENAVTSATPTGAWTPLLKRIQDAKQQRQFTTVSGPEYFGFANPKCKKLIEKLPNADRCTNYQKEVFGSAVLNATPRRRRRSTRKTTAPVRFDSLYGDTPSSGTIGAMSLKTPRNGSSSASPQGRAPSSRRDADRRRRSSSSNSGGKQSEDFVTEDEDKEWNENDENDGGTRFRYPILPSKYPGCTSERPLPTLLPSFHRNMEHNLPVFESTEKFCRAMLKYNDPNYFSHNMISVDNQSQTNDSPDPKTLLRDMWEFAYICFCIHMISPVLKIGNFEPEDLEQALLDPENNNGFLSDLHIRAMRGPVIDKKSNEYMDPLSWEWMNVLKIKLEKPEMAWYRLWEQSPLFGNQLYIDLSPAWRVLLLKSIVDWKMDHTQRVIDSVRNKSEEYLRYPTIGSDRDGNVYHYIGAYVGRVFKEKPPKVKNPEKSDTATPKLNETHAGDAQSMGNGHAAASTAKMECGSYQSAEVLHRGSWTAVCDDLASLKEFAEQFANSNDEREKHLYNNLNHVVIPELQAYCNETGRPVSMAPDERKAAMEKRRVDREAKFLQRANKKLGRPLDVNSLSDLNSSYHGEQTPPQQQQQQQLQQQQPQPKFGITLPNPGNGNSIRFRLLPNPSQTTIGTPNSRRSTRSGRAAKRSYSELLDPLRDSAASSTTTPRLQAKRKRGRPRKYPRPDVDEYVPSYAHQQSLYKQHAGTQEESNDQDFDEEHIDKDDEDEDDSMMVNDDGDDGEYEDDSNDIDEEEEDDDDDDIQATTQQERVLSTYRHLPPTSGPSPNKLVLRMSGHNKNNSSSSSSSSNRLVTTMHERPSSIYHHQSNTLQGLEQHMYGTIRATPPATATLSQQHQQPVDIQSLLSFGPGMTGSTTSASQSTYQRNNVMETDHVDQSSENSEDSSFEQMFFN